MKMHMEKHLPEGFLRELNTLVKYHRIQINYKFTIKEYLLNKSDIEYT